MIPTSRFSRRRVPLPRDGRARRARWRVPRAARRACSRAEIESGRRPGCWRKIARSWGLNNPGSQSDRRRLAAPSTGWIRHRPIAGNVPACRPPDRVSGSRSAAPAAADHGGVRLELLLFAGGGLDVKNRNSVRNNPTPRRPVTQASISAVNSILRDVPGWSRAFRPADRPAERTPNRADRLAAASQYRAGGQMRVE